MSQLSSTLAAIAGRIGESDCELLGSGGLVQPVNALTSFAYVVVGVGIAVRALRFHRSPLRSVIYATTVAAVGFGSVLFHGPQPDGSRVLHDLPILLAIVFIVSHDLRLLLPRYRHDLAGFLVAGAVATAATAVEPAIGTAMTGAGVVAVAILELLVYRRGLRPIDSRRQRRAYAAIIGVAVVAGASWLLGRTGSPLCDPDGVFQYHGLWHAISALMFGLWWWLAFDHPSDEAMQRQPGGDPSTGASSEFATVGGHAVESTRRDRAVAKIAGFVARSAYRDIDVHWSTPPQTSGPELTVSNHFGGAADALLLLSAMIRPPGIIARDVIWRVPVVGRLMNAIGAIPVHKPEDGGSKSGNDEMFASCYSALGEGRHLLIFPEGVTRNEPSIARVKTGAARIALGARADGTDGLMITPVGIHYEDKAALRSRVVINAGTPIAVDAVAAELEASGAGSAGGTGGVTADDRVAVDALTDEIEQALRAAAPDYENWEEARALSSAAETALRATLDDPRRPVPIGLRERLSNVLAERPPEDRAAILAAVARYDEHLDGLGVTDADVHGHSGLFRFVGSLFAQLLLFVVLFPFALAGAITNIVPFLVVKAVGLLRVAPSMHATIKPIVAIVAYGITWALVIWGAALAWGVEGAAAAFILLPVYLTATMLFVERTVLLWRSVRREGTGLRVRGQVERLDLERAGVIEAVWSR